MSTMEDMRRPSTSTDRLGLLDNHSFAESLRTASLSGTTEGALTPRANSIRSTIAPTISSESLTLPPPQTYRGFPSEEAYLDALREWAEEKKYIQPSEDAQMLQGFYGTKTMGDYLGAKKVERTVSRDDTGSRVVGVDENGRVVRGEVGKDDTKENVKEVKEGSAFGKLWRRKSKKPDGA